MTGLDVATMLGDDFRELYLKSKRRKEQELNEEKQKFFDTFNRLK